MDAIGFSFFGFLLGVFFMIMFWFWSKFEVIDDEPIFFSSDDGLGDLVPPSTIPQDQWFQKVI